MQASILACRFGYTLTEGLIEGTRPERGGEDQANVAAVGVMIFGAEEQCTKLTGEMIMIYDICAVIGFAELENPTIAQMRSVMLVSATPSSQKIGPRGLAIIRKARSTT